MTLSSVVLVVAGLVVLVAGAEAVVRGASRLALVMGISPLVVGLTVVAFGTSAPEVAIGVQAARAGQTSLALGNVTGSNMFNTLAALGVAAVIGMVAVQQKLVRRELPLVVGVSLVVLLMSLNGVLSPLEGGLLVAGSVIYVVWAIRSSRSESTDVKLEYAADLAAGGVQRHWSVYAGLSLVGLVGLVVGARWLVSGATDIAEALGMSELLIGVTIVAIGTSLPELATTIVAAVRGERDIAVGNVLGSNLFNLLVVLGLTAVVAPGGVPVPSEALNFQLPALVVVAVLCFGVFYTRWAVHRWEGLALLALYVAYLAYSVAEATDAGWLPAMRLAGLGLLGLVVAAVVVSTVRAWRSGNHPAGVSPS